jgi:asparagine synthase (glutamine-hydrolysing)
MKTMISALNKKGEDAASAVFNILQSTCAQKNCSPKLISYSTIKTEKSFKPPLGNQSFTSPAVLGFTHSKSQKSTKHQLVKFSNATLVLDGTIYSNSQISIRNFVVENLENADFFKLGEAILDNIEGGFSFLILDKDKIIVGRDPVGVQPLYYGENETIAALASSRKAMWTLGIENPQSFPPGNLALVSGTGFEFKPIKKLAYSEPEPVPMEKAAEQLQILLEEAVRVRMAEKIAIAFSGGLDSSIIAALARKHGAEVHLFHVSLENQPETDEAIKAANYLKLPLHTYLYNEKDVENVLPEVISLIEEDDPLKASIGVPMYWTARRLAEEGFHVLLAGQGADELFGGYQRYVNQYLLLGDEKTGRAIFSDVIKLHETNIERDVKICRFHDVELRLPFAAYQIIKFATKLPLKLKIEKRQDSLRKLVLRKTAGNMGLPVSITDKPKKAMQYSTGVYSAMKKISRKQKITLKEHINRLFLLERHK